QQDLDSSVAYRFEVPERARRRWSGTSNRLHWPQFVAESRVLEQPARRHGKVLRHEYTAREYAERAFEHAHVLVKHHVRDGGAGQQRLDHGHQDGVIGSQDFVQNSPPESLSPPLDLPRCPPRGRPFSGIEHTCRITIAFLCSRSLQESSLAVIVP